MDCVVLEAPAEVAPHGVSGAAEILWHWAWVTIDAVSVDGRQPGMDSVEGFMLLSLLLDLFPISNNTLLSNKKKGRTSCGAAQFVAFNRHDVGIDSVQSHIRRSNMGT